MDSRIRRPALDILRDVRAYGGNLNGDPLTGRLSIVGSVPQWLALEVHDRSLDLSAICFEFDDLGLRAISAAESIVMQAVHTPRKRRSTK